MRKQQDWEGASNVNHPVLTDERPLALYASLGSVEALASETLEHGAYYAGKVGTRPVVARWHAKKRRFVFGEFTLARQCVRSVAHIADNGAAERFIPLSKTEPRDAYRVSDYALETGA